MKTVRGGEEDDKQEGREKAAHARAREQGALEKTAVVVSKGGKGGGKKQGCEIG